MTVKDMPSDALIDSIIKERIRKLNQNSIDIEHDMPFLVADTRRIFRQHERWLQCLPNIAPFYAVKCNPDVRLLRYLARLGVGFDCASWGEMKLVLDLGVDPTRIIFAHPCKAVSALQMASRRGVPRTTFDNVDELEKIKNYAPSLRLLLRIYADDATALVSLGNKFGAPLDTTKALLLKAKELGLTVEGVSFHVGSGASNADTFVTAVQNAQRVFQQGKQLGFNMHVLDVGGGFQDSNFEQMALTLQQTIEKEFPPSTQVIAEPGRYYARSFYTAACKVIARRKQIGQDRLTHTDMLYLNDGIYGCFMNAVAENEIYCPILVRRGTASDPERETGEHRYSVWGPTCDGLDCIAKEATMDCEIKVGDWVKFENMGSYTVATSTQFNGFPNRYDIIYVDDHLPLRWDREITASSKRIRSEAVL
ncbi:pyridoxal-dependent decarboxylase [Aspergillus pseudonomiae]|uniref:ornithine decarboxylase n=1 Tax=Aspergillus pseudonomiae TaxID=1506151 RepID=A0A5N7DK94_9EURO|nr:pyridoxal-dependent decarboxylase [Aspergillus pseudonomiae]KAB8261625.1 pyridoxal-dependent decarboxylase [Aspergillus pseudonomiae]KAE8406857.1 pyridoxal-dependent decarboxylase [Aspergillus pseudonomiae]